MKRAIVTATLILLFPVPPAAACSCVLATPQAYLANADAAFSGTVLDVTADGLVIFDVGAVYKGEVPVRASVKTMPGCEVPFTAGHRYTVFADQQAGVLTSGLCSGTSQDPTLLGAGRSPSPAPSPRALAPVASTEKAQSRAAAMLLALGLALMNGAALLKARAIH